MIDETKLIEQLNILLEANKNYGHDNTNMAILQLIVLVFVVFMMILVLKSKKDIVEGIKSELDINDLKQQMTSIQEEVRTVYVVMEKNIEVLDRIHDAVKNQTAVMVAGKEFSKEEMYQMLTNRLQLSIKQITDDFIDVVEQNSLFENEHIIKAETRGKINYRVYQGRDFIYSINFDKRIIDIVFCETDKAVDQAEKALNSFYDEFFKVGKENITTNDYKALKRKIRGLGKQMRMQSDQLLRKNVLGVNN